MLVGRLSMPKIVTAKRREDVREQARRYLKSRVMLPTIPLAMVTLLVSLGDMGWQWIQNSYTPEVFSAGFLLFVTGAVWGWGHARYERYLMESHPAYFARKHKILEAAKEYKRSKREDSDVTPIHPGRRWVPLAYGVGVIAQLGMTVYYAGQAGVYLAFFLPWAGYFTAKSVCLRDMLTA